jgi:hypothetical protein
MGQCKNCFTPVDGRSSVKCSECTQPLHKECAISFGGALFCDVCFTVREEKPKSKFGEFTLPEHIRRTHIETYRSCPYKFYLEVLKDNPMPPNEYTQVGQDVHEVIEKYILNQMEEREARAHMEHCFETYEDDLFTYKTREEMKKRSDDSLDTFFEFVVPHLFGDTFAVEETIFTNIGDDIPDVRITMDLITERDSELEMHDWKTGRVMVGKKLSSDLQAPLYIYSVQKKYGKPVRSFTFYYLQENKTRTFTRNPDNPDEYICMVGKREYKVSLTNAIREVKSIFSRIKKGDFNIPQDTRSMHFTCKMCHLQEQGLCAGAEEQSWAQMN